MLYIIIIIIIIIIIPAMKVMGTSSMFFIRTDLVCHVWWNILPSYTCRTAIIFGTKKDFSLSINTLASNNCLYHRNLFQNGVNTFSNTVNHYLPKKVKSLYIDIYHTILF